MRDVLAGHRYRGRREVDFLAGRRDIAFLGGRTEAKKPEINCVDRAMLKDFDFAELRRHRLSIGSLVQ
jgi:hypothetical protein